MLKDYEKWSLISPSVTRSTPTLLRKSGSHGEPHAQPALCWRRLESTVSPTTTWQTPSRPCIPTGCANVSTKPRGLGPARLPGAVSALASDNALGKLAVSTDHIPPTSAARTTKRARPLSAGLTLERVISFFLRASSRATPLWSAALLHALSSRFRGGHHRGVCGELGSVKEGQPVHDNLQPPCIYWIPSLDVKVSHHDICRNTSSLLLCKPALPPVPMRNPWLPEPPPPRTLLDGGHSSRGDGHIGRCGRRKAKGGGGDDTTEPGTVVDRSASTETSGKP